DHGGLGEERIDRRCDRVGHQAHVGFIDRLPPGNRRAVEHDAFREGLLLDHADVESYMLPLAARIGETQVDVFDVVVLDRLQDVFAGLHGVPLWLSGRFEKCGMDGSGGTTSVRASGAAYGVALMASRKRKRRIPPGSDSV